MTQKSRTATLQAGRRRSGFGVIRDEAKRTGILRRLLLAGLCAGLVGPSSADPAVTTASSNMRRMPNVHSHVVQSVPADAQIDLQSCTGDWCYGSWRGFAGYLPSFAVAQAGPPTVAPPPPVVVAPTFGWGGPYVGVGYGWGWRHW